ncbi:MAG: sigma 54-interacting transcriptional regulator [Treponema sp.]|nr:sigma 54-interacting transcriptional regulator [Treponema sp.]
MKEILLVAPYKQMYDSALQMVKNQKYRNIDVVRGNQQAGLVQALNAVENHVRVVISRGCTYQLIKEANIGLPVVEIRLSPSELIESLSAAIEKDRPLAIVGYSNVINSRDETMIKKIIKTPLTIVNIDDSDDVKDVVSSCAAQGFSMFIGDTIVKETCDAAGYECYLHQSSDSSIQAAMDEALRIYAALQQEQELARRLRTVIDFANDGIIAIDGNGRVILFNAIAQDLLGIKQEKILGEPIEALSILPFAGGIKKDGQVIDQTFRIGNRLLSGSIIPVSMEKFSFGSVIIIRDIQKIQDWEQKLRVTLMEKGFVAKHKFSSIVHKNTEMAHCISIAKKFSQYNASVLIEGESGVGKELFAQSIHNEGIRRKGPFVAVNCAVLPKSLIESELFGYAEGAFTGSRKGGKPGYFELAHRGTLFLDEISELPLEVQAQLLRVIQEKEVMRIGDSKIIPIDVRLICAANKNLVEMVHESLFRKDLLFRINTLSLYIPSLSKRREDIELLSGYFLKELCKTYNKNIEGFSPNAAVWLCNYHYEGNIRELRNIVERAVIICEGTIIRLRDLRDGRREDASLLKAAAEHIVTAETTALDDIEKNHISRVLADNHWSMTKASAALGISRTTLWRKIHGLGL